MPSRKSGFFFRVNNLLFRDPIQTSACHIEALGLSISSGRPAPERDSFYQTVRQGRASGQQAVVFFLEQLVQTPVYILCFDKVADYEVLFLSLGGKGLSASDAGDGNIALFSDDIR